MDALIPGHAHRSSSDRLLNNYLDSQKSVSTSLLNLLSQSHSSTSSLLAYVTSSPGVVHPVRRSVRHAGFEGPLSAALAESAGSQLGSITGDAGGPGWAVYLSSLDRFRTDLKQIHMLEQELSRVKRDREILVTRLIKTTKSRPTKSDLSAIANSYSQREGSVMSSRASTLSLGSNGSHASKEGKRAGKLAEAQAELLGCEEHLRSLEVRIEHERNKVMLRGLEDRFHSMEAVGRMWIRQAKAGLEDLEKAAELPPEAFEVDSNSGSIAPSMSASQTGFEDRPKSKKKRTSGLPYPKVTRHMKGPGSVADSIAEEDEDSSDDGGNLVMHENHPGGGSRMIQRPASKAGTATNKPSPLGVPSVNARSRPLSATGYLQRGGGGGLGDDSSDSDVGNPRAGGRRAASDIGAMAYRPPKNRQVLRRTFSNEERTTTPQPQRAASETSSIRPKKKKGFFAAISRFFKGPNRRQGSVSGRDSPPYGSGSKNKGGWNTRTNQNLKSQTSLGGRNRGNESSSDEEGGNFVSVANSRIGGTPWNAADVGRPQSSASVRRSNTMPVASGLIPSKPGGNMSRNHSQSTINANKGAGSLRGPSPAPPGGRKTPTAGVARGKSTKSATSGGVKSVSSAGDGPSRNGTVKKKKALASGNAARAAIDSQQAAEGRNIMSLVDMDTPSSAPYVAKAPRSQVDPQMELARAPGSSLAPPPESKPSLSRSSSTRKAGGTDTDAGARSTTPLPPSRTLAPPLKSALRPATPSPTMELAPPLDNMYSISAPGPVDIQREEVKPIPIPQAARTAPSAVAAAAIRPPTNKRMSYQSNTTAGESVYHSAEDGEGEGEAGPDSSSEDETVEGGYEVVENANVMHQQEDVDFVPEEVVKIPMTDEEEEEEEDDDSVYSHDTATLPTHADEGGKRKSVRIRSPDSPDQSTSALARAAPAAPAPAATAPAPQRTSHSNRPTSPAPERPTDAQWDTRIGRMRDDTTDEESDPDDGYRNAKKGLMKSGSGAWEAVNNDDKVKKGKKAGSVKSRGGRASGR